MTPLEHKKQAEAMLEYIKAEKAKFTDAGQDIPIELAPAFLVVAAEAQVHAALALTNVTWT